MDVMENSHSCKKDKYKIAFLSDIQTDIYNGYNIMDIDLKNECNAIYQRAQSSQKSRPVSQRRHQADISQDRLKVFKAALLKAFKVTRSQSVAVPDLLTHINKGQDEEFDQTEINLLLERMQDDNQVMLSENVVFLI